MISPQAQELKRSILKLVPVAPNTFRLMGENGGANVGELLVFELGPDGKVVRVKVGSNFTYPVH